MKKVLALVLCALMIITAAFPVFADDTEPVANEGKLAITEVAPNPVGGESFEYIEVINTIEGTTVDLKDYYIYRFIFAFAGKTAYTGFGRLLGTGTNALYDTGANSGTLKVSLASIVDAERTTLKSTDGPMVIWLKSDATQTLDNFKIYWWNTTGTSIDEKNIVEIDVSAVTVYNAHKTAGYYGNGFLPDTKAAYIVSLVNKSFADLDTYDTSAGTNGRGGMDTDEPAVNTIARHKAADTMTMIYASGNVPGKVANRYGYFDAKAFDDAVVEAEFNNPATATLSTQDRYDSYMMPKPAPDGTVQLTRVENTNHTWRNMEATESCYVLDVAACEDPTPGKLVAGQPTDGVYKNVEAVSAETKGLAITEIMPATDASAMSGDENEFIEVTNTNDSAVTLTNYHIILHGGTNDGGSDGTFVQRAFHGTQPAYQKSYAKITSVYKIDVSKDGVLAYETTYSLKSGETAVIFFKNDVVWTDVVAFAEFWMGGGNDMDGVTIAVATYEVGDSGDVKTSLATRGMGFLPDAKVGYGLALVDSTKRLTDATLDRALTNSESLGTEGSATYGKAIEAAADSVLWIIAEGGVEKNVSCNYYGYVDMNKYKADAQYYAQQIIARKGTSTTALSEEDGIYQLQPHTVVMKGQPLYIYMKMYTKISGSSTWFGYGESNNAATTVHAAANNVCVATILNSVPTPGKLLHGQFGYDAHAESETIDVVGYQQGTVASNIRIVGNLNNVTSADFTKYKYVGVEIAGATAATNANTIWSETDKLKNISNAVCTKFVDITSETVYKTLTDTNGTKYTNEGGYMFAINIKDLPTNIHSTLTFRCFIEDNAGNRTYTGTYQISDTSYNALAY